MKILNKKQNINLLILNENYNKIDLDWENNFKEYENDALNKVINPLENYEMSIFNFNSYLLDSQYLINDLHIKFLFENNNNYQNFYQSIGFINKDIYTNNDYFKKSFFRLEYYKTENDILPTKSNRRLVTTKTINLNDGEMYLDTNINEYIYKPYFISSTVLNKSINNFFWFQDDTVVKNSNLGYNIFWITAKFFNAKNGFIYDFINNNNQNDIDESYDVYYKLILNDNYTYTLLDLNDNLVGTKETPLIFYQRNG